MHWLKRGYLTIAVLLVLVVVGGGLTVSAKNRVNEVDLLISNGWRLAGQLPALTAAEFVFPSPSLI
jgi:hypothetical protein